MRSVTTQAVYVVATLQLLYEVISRGSAGTTSVRAVSPGLFIKISNNFSLKIPSY